MSEAVILSAGPWRAEIAPTRGGRMARLTFEDREVLEPIRDWNPSDRPWPAGGLYPLVPYSNRIPNGRLAWAGGTVPIEPFPRGSAHATHGPGHRRRWEVAERTGSAIRLRLRYAPDGEWPWAFATELDFALTEDAVTARIALSNRSDEPMPAGIGLHPFFHAPNGSRVALAYRDRWPQAEADSPETDYGDSDRRLDKVVGDDLVLSCLGGWSGAALIERPDLRIRVEAAEPLSSLVLYRAPGSAFLCIEPVSHVTNGFNLQAEGRMRTGAVLLEPGGSFAGAMAIRCERL